MSIRKISMAALQLIFTMTPPVFAENQILDEITIRGQKEQLQQESLSIREVRESPARDIGEALKQVEGVNSIHKGAIANDIVLRGMQKDNINVLVDGARLHGACPGRMDPPAFHYDFAEIEQVTITKGPYDLSNPGGLGGTINALTKKPHKGIGGDISLTYGEWNNINSSVTASHATERYDALIGYAYKFSDIPRSGDGKRLTEIYPTVTGQPGFANRYKASAIDSKAYEINTGWAKLGFNPTANSRTEISYTYQDSDHVLYPYLKMDADYDNAHRINWNYGIKNVSSLIKELKLQAYWNKIDHLMDDRFRASSTPSMSINRFYSMQSDAKSEVYGFKANGTMAIGSGTLTSGIDYYNRNWDGVNRRAMYNSYADVAMIPDVNINTMGLFSEYQLPLSSRLSFKSGLRGDITWIEANKSNTMVASGTSRDYSDFSANMQLTWSPVKGVDIFTAIGRSTRTPDQQELYIDIPVMAASATSQYWHGNKSLKSTINHQADMGIKFANDRFYANASLFYSDLTDYVNFYQVPGTFEKSYQNIHATLWGAEFGSQLALPLDLFLRGTLSYVEGENESAGTPLAEIPPLKGSVSLRYDNGTFFAEIAENMAREQDRLDPNLNEQRTGGWVTTDIKSGLNYNNFSMIVGINNLFDQQYYSHLSFARDPFANGVGLKVPENGRNFYTTISYRF